MLEPAKINQRGFMLKKTMLFCVSSLMASQFLFSQNNVVQAEIDEDTSSIIINLDRKEVKQEKAKEETKKPEENSLQNKLEDKTPSSIIVNLFNKNPKDLDLSKKQQEETVSQPDLKKNQAYPQSYQRKKLSPQEGVDSTIGYFETGIGPFPLPLPEFGLGFRRQVDKHGFDGSFRVSTIVVLTQVNGSLMYQYYPKPNLESEFYMGVGLSGSGIFGDYKSHFLIGPDFVLGRQFKTKTDDIRFYQMKISWPTFAPNSHHDTVTYFPLVVFSYGFGF